MLQLRSDPGKLASNTESTGNFQMRIVPIAALALLLAGCSYFSTTQAWTKPGTTAEEAEYDLDTCKAIARASEDNDENIDRDTDAAMGDAGQGAVDTELSQNMSSQRTGKRGSDIIDDCMRQLGYSPAD